MMARGTIARSSLSPAAPPTFSGQLTKVTGEGETVVIAFTATTHEELTEWLAAAASAAHARLQANNDLVLRAGEAFEARQRAVYDAAVAQLRRALAPHLERPPEEDPEPDDEAPVGPPEPEDAPAPDEEPDADDPAGTLDAPEDR